MVSEIRHFAVHGVHEPQHQRFMELVQRLLRGFVPCVQVLGGGVHDLPGLLQRGEGGGGKLFGVRVQHTEQFRVRQRFAVFLHMLAEPFAGGVGDPGVGFRDFSAVCLLARVPVQAVDVGQHADDADRASAAGQLAEQGQFGMGARIAGVHDEDDAVRLKAFLVGKIVMKLIGIIEAGRVHEHDARPERVQREPHADAGHEP